MDIINNKCDDVLATLNTVWIIVGRKRYQKFAEYNDACKKIIHEMKSSADRDINEYLSILADTMMCTLSGTDLRFSDLVLSVVDDVNDAREVLLECIFGVDSSRKGGDVYRGTKLYKDTGVFNNENDNSKA